MANNSFFKVTRSGLDGTKLLLWRKKTFCECVTMITGLSIFTAFTLYIIFAYGFTIFGTKHPFNVVEPSYSKTRNGTKSMEVT